MRNFRIRRLDYEETTEEEIADVTEEYADSPILINLGGGVYFPTSAQGDGHLELREFDRLRFELRINDEWVPFEDFIHNIKSKF